MHEHEAIIEYIIENLPLGGDMRWEHTDEFYYDVFKNDQWLFEVEFYGGNMLAYYDNHVNIMCPLASPNLIENIDKFLKGILEYEGQPCKNTKQFLTTSKKNSKKP